MTLKINKQLALFYGILAGDGCISRSERCRYISITCSLRDDKKFFDDVVVPLTERLRGKPVVYGLRPKYGKIEINFSDKALFEELKVLGFPIGKKGRRLKIPSAFPKRLWKHIIAGVFATDGCIVFANNNGILYPRLEIQSISPRFLRQIRGFLVENGLWGHVYKINAKPGIIYRLEFPGKENLIKFKRKIGFVNAKHETRFAEYFKRIAS